MIHVSIYQQDCWGKEHWRVVRDDGRLIFDRHQTDFDTEEDALLAIEGECRRNKLGKAQVRVCYGHRQSLPSHVKPDDRIVIIDHCPVCALPNYAGYGDNGCERCGT